MKGTLYGVGVGPGDPELLTLKAVRMIREAAVIAIPDSGTGEHVALDIAAAHVQDQPILRLPLPMTRDQAALHLHRVNAADQICEQLAQGKDVAFLTLGDPTIYATYSYLHRMVEERGYSVKMIPGVPSFCAAAAALGMPLCEAGQPLHILPASYAGADASLELDGVKVLMKSGKKLGELLGTLKEKGMLSRAALAERVGMAEERLQHDLTDTTQSGYFSIVIVKPEEQA